MDEIREFVDERQKAWCIHCGGWLAGLEKSRDHVPTKTLLHAPYPTNLPVVAICNQCNGGFSKDEQYFVAFLGSVISGSTEPGLQSNPDARRILEKNDKLRARIARSKKEYRTPGGEIRFVWEPELERINRVIVKNARGHALFEYGEPMLHDPTQVGSQPLVSFTAAERKSFENVSSGGLAAWLEVGSRMMTRVITGQDLDGSWVTVQKGVYRYAVIQSGGGIVVRTVIADYLATEVSWVDAAAS